MSSVDVSHHQIQQLSSAMNALLQPSLHDPHVEPHRQPKTGFSSEAAGNLERSRGTLLLVGTGSDTARCRQAGAGGDGPARAPRVLGRDGEDILQRSYGTAGQLIYATNPCNDVENATMPPRVKGDGEENLRRSVNGTMATLLNADCNRSYRSPHPVPRVPSEEAGANAARNRGVMGKVLDTEANRDYRSARHQGPRVASGGGDGETNALNGRGTMIAVLAHHTAELDRRNTAQSTQTSDIARQQQQQQSGEEARNRRSVFGLALAGQLPGTPVADVRIKGDCGRQNYEHGTRGAVGSLLANYDRNSINDSDATAACRPPSRVNGGGTGIARLGQSGTVNRLLVDYGGQPASGRPEPRIKPEARRTASYGTGKTMAGYVNPRRTPGKRPTRRKLGLSKKPRPATAAVAFGTTAERPFTAAGTRTTSNCPNPGRPKTAPPGVYTVHNNRCIYGSQP